MCYFINKYKNAPKSFLKLEPLPFDVANFNAI